MNETDKNLRELGYQTRSDSILTNTWMNSVTYLAAMAHVGWATLILLAVNTFAHSLRWVVIASVLLVVFAALKEFWYDARYELPPQSMKDNAQDFVGYLGGILLAWIIIASATLAQT